MKRITVLLILVAIMNLGIGCTHIASRPAEEIPEAGSLERQLSGVIDSIHSLKLKTGKTIRFEKPGGKIETDSSVVTGITKSYRRGKKTYGGERAKIELKDVQKLNYKKPAPLLTALAVAGVVTVAVGIAALIQAASFDFDMGRGSR